VSGAPWQWPLQALSYLPDALRIGMLVAVPVLLVWFFSQGCHVALWRLLCRATGYALAIAALAWLHIEHANTRSRRRRGREPLRVAFVLGPAAERLLDRARALHSEHPPRRDGRLRLWPLWICAGALVLSIGSWYAMTRTRPTSAVSYGLSLAFEEWRMAEVWSEVPRDRLAARGPGVLPAPPEIVRTRRAGRGLAVRLHCGAPDPCRGTLVVRTGGGRQLRHLWVRVPRVHNPVVIFGFSRAPARGVRVAVADTDRRRR
jgi:hypothetical protein